MPYVPAMMNMAHHVSGLILLGEDTTGHLTVVTESRKLLLEYLNNNGYTEELTDEEIFEYADMLLEDEPRRGF